MSPAVPAGQAAGMDPTISADHTAFRAAVDDVRLAADRLRAERARASDRVEGLLGAGWRGVAATAYAEGWAAWTEASGRVLAALEEMAALLAAVDADLAATDGSAAGSIARLAARLG